MKLEPRHIQNFSEAAYLEPHWGYADRARPCTNDPGSCEYLDVVYSAHDRGMIYTGIFWLTIGGIILVWAAARRLFPARDAHDDLIAQLASSDPEKSPPPPQSRTARLFNSMRSASRRYLLPNAPFPFIFGHTTRLQLLILAILTGYLTVWSFVGMVYKRWLTPIKNQPPDVYNTRSTLGPWADRVGVLAYALTPLSVLLASRESLLSIMTGVPYTSFLFLHKWVGYIILVQSLLHTLGWVLVEAWLYRPQPQVWNTWIAQDYARWGVVALVLLVLLWIGTLGVVVRRVTGYEFFRKAHYVLAMVYIGALIGHWEKLQCFLVPGLVLWGADRIARAVRTALLHHGYLKNSGRWGFESVEAVVKHWKDEQFGDVVRLDFDHVQAPWKIGQHFFICFTEGSIWQSHPFTPLSLPVTDTVGKVRHSYIFRAKKGETKRIANIVAKKVAAATKETAVTTNVILQGPYGVDVTEGLIQDVNVLCVAGGTGITYVLPVLLRLVRGPVGTTGRKIELVWAMKRKRDLEWVAPELEELQRLGAAHGLQICTFVTADPEDSSSKESGDENGATESGDDVKTFRSQRPDVGLVVQEFVKSVSQGSVRVFGSGPPGMICDLRAAVAKCNSGSKVWKGEDRFDVHLVCDDRLE